MPDPNHDAPAPTRRFLSRFGGHNPHGKPMWRVCLAEHVLVERSGIFREMPNGDKEVYYFDEKGRLIQEPPRPTSTKKGTFLIPRYPKSGWILERWHPPSRWGSKAAWEAQMSSDGITPMMGPFPAQGDYYYVAGPFPECPPVSDMEQAIAMWEREEAERPTDIEAETIRLLDEEKSRQAKILRKAEEELAYILKHGPHKDVLRLGAIARKLLEEEIRKQDVLVTA